MERNDKILARIEPGMRVLEIGPSFAPILPKAENPNVLTLDHATREELQEKYRDAGPDVSKIETVDFVWRSGPVHDSVPESLHGTFDAIVMSHVLEHSPDPVGFLKSAEVLLRDGGYVSLANPDRRYTFDALKPLTTTGEMVEAYLERRQRHSRRTMFEQAYLSIRNNDALVWGEGYPIGTVGMVDPNFEWPPARTPEDPYMDCHAWYFTPASFELLILELGQLGFIGFEMEVTFDSWGCEFYNTLRKSKPGRMPRPALEQARLDLHRRIMGEMRVQIDAWLARDQTPAASVVEAAAEPIEATEAVAPESGRRSYVLGPLKRFRRRLGARL